MDHQTKVSKLKGYLVLRWMDQSLTWDPAEWAGINMVYMSSKHVWKPDFMITNQNNASSINIGKYDDTMVRVWADRSSSSDLEQFNIEWAP